jgi:hypothetical protein
MATEQLNEFEIDPSSMAGPSEEEEVPTTTEDDDEEVVTDDEEVPSDDDEPAEDVDEDAPIEEVDEDPGFDAKGWYKGDGRKLPADLKAVIAANPKLAKPIKDAYFRGQALSNLGSPKELAEKLDLLGSFGSTPEELSKTVQLFAEYGGAEGVNNAFNELQQRRGFEQMYSNGDGDKVVAEMMNVNPDGLSAMLPSAIGAVARHNPELWNHLAADTIYQSLINTGAYSNLMILDQAVKSGNLELAGESLKEVLGFVQGVKGLAGKAPAPKTSADTPYNAKITEMQNSIEQERTASFQKEYNSQFGPWLWTEATKIMAPYLKNSKFSKNTQNRIISSLMDEIKPELVKNTNLVNQRKTLYAKRDTAGLMTLMKKAVPSVLEACAPKVATDYALKPLSKQQQKHGVGGTRNTPGEKVPTGWKVVTEPPSKDEVDTSKMSWDDQVWADKFYMKDGSKLKLKAA